MKIIESSFDIVNPRDKVEGINLLRKIEYMARISHRSEEKQTFDSYDKFLRTVVIDRADWSVTEHASASVIFRTDRGTTHELVRHRLFSFTQESTRFVRYGDRHQFEFIQPERMAEDNQSIDLFKTYCTNAESVYNTLLARGGRPQEARAVLPNSLAATIAATANLRAWRWLFLARTTREANPDFKKFIVPLLREFQDRIPILYDDIIPESRQKENAEKAH